MFVIAGQSNAVGYGATWQELPDDLHFTTQGQLEMGRRFIAAWLQMTRGMDPPRFQRP